MLKVCYQLRRRLKNRLSFAKRRLVKPAFPKNSDGKVLIRVGCGRTNSPEFISFGVRPN